MIKEKFDFEYEVQNVYYPCIYFLFKEGKIVYIGQTEYGLKRILAHIPEKDFDTIKIIKCKKKDLNEKEIIYISKYQPIYNKQLSNAISATRIKYLLIEKGYRIRKNIIRRWIMNNIKKYYLFCGEIYVSNRDKDYTLEGLTKYIKEE